MPPAWDFRGRDSRGEHVGARPRQEGQPTTPARVCRTDRRQGGPAGGVGGYHWQSAAACRFSTAGFLLRRNRSIQPASVRDFLVSPALIHQVKFSPIMLVVYHW